MCVCIHAIRIKRGEETHYDLITPSTSYKIYVFSDEKGNHCIFLKVKSWDKEGKAGLW